MIGDMKRGSPSEPVQPTIYQIVVRGELSSRYLPAFEGMTLAVGDGRTVITGPVLDQAQLHGLVDRVGDLGLELISINPTPDPPTSAPVAWTGT